MANYWVGVVSKDHVEKGKLLEICQFCHGKSWPLKKISNGDYIIYYSPKKALNSTVPYKKFTAIAYIEDNDIYQERVSDHFSPYRIKARFIETSDVQLIDLKTKLSFLQSTKNYGLLFRKGFFQIKEGDFKKIYRAMTA